MILLNVSFSVYAFLPQAWLFMTCIILGECFLNSKLLINKWMDKKIFISTMVTNLASAVCGIMLTLYLNGGLYLAVWFPLAGDQEVDLNNAAAKQSWILFYICCFVLTILTEAIFKLVFLYGYFALGPIVRTTLFSNLVTYFAGSSLLYSHSFG